MQEFVLPQNSCILKRRSGTEVVRLDDTEFLMRQKDAIQAHLANAEQKLMSRAAKKM